MSYRTVVMAFLEKLIEKYEEILARFQHKPQKFPIIVAIDNDDGAKDIFSLLRNKFKKDIGLTTADYFYPVTHNLYVVKTPEIGVTGVSCIEDFFPPDVLSTELSGKKFSPDEKADITAYYGKRYFAEHVVREKMDSIDFSGFTALLERIYKVLQYHQAIFSALPP